MCRHFEFLTAWEEDAFFADHTVRKAPMFVIFSQLTMVRRPCVIMTTSYLPMIEFDQAPVYGILVILVSSPQHRLNTNQLLHHRVELPRLSTRLNTDVIDHIVGWF